MIIKLKCKLDLLTAVLMNASVRGADTEDVRGTFKPGGAVSSAVLSVTHGFNPRVLCRGLGLGGSLSEKQKSEHNICVVL